MTANIDFTQAVSALSALLTPLIAIITALILVLQYLLACRRWRLDLYDKRYPVFICTMDYIVFAAGEEMTHERLFQFLRESKDKDFLFGTDVRSFLDGLYKRGVDLRTTQSIYAHMPVGDERTKHVNREDEIRKWFLDQLDIAKQLFGHYLAITER
jgi:hypothetical protein